MPTDPAPDTEPKSDQPSGPAHGQLLLGDGRVVTPRHTGGEYTLCELVHQSDTTVPVTTANGLHHRRARPAGSLIPLPNKTLATAATASTAMPSSAYLLALAAAGIPTPTAPATAAASNPFASTRAPHRPCQAPDRTKLPTPATPPDPLTIGPGPA
ncbi:hypothetical protein [Polymorphospora rubra]|uniref:Uncharacterized protein n=1 Tax=Polymorphospora rubra TaxID=338584 RepID=A0A810NEX5_9ACTN|nr:hypothetical protein [Polymorphospora rubra]BCJ70448.1 hypothetical protein Prubr_74690 [Polymorphospora rubra]